MLGDLTAAFGLTVLCLAPIMLVSLVFPPILMRFTRPQKDQPTAKKRRPANKSPQQQDDDKRGPVGAVVAFARFYLISLVVLVTLTVVFWWGFLLIAPTDAVTDFASQSVPAVEREQVEEAVEPAGIIDPETAP